MLWLQANADQKEEEEGKWAATKGMQYSARGRKLTYSRKAIVLFVLPIVAWMALIILNYGLSYMFISNTEPRLDIVNGGSRVQAYSKSYFLSCQVLKQMIKLSIGSGAARLLLDIHL